MNVPNQNQNVKSQSSPSQQDHPIGGRIETVRNILGDLITYVDELTQNRYLWNLLSDFEFAQQQVDKNVHTMKSSTGAITGPL